MTPELLLEMRTMAQQAIARERKRVERRRNAIGGDLVRIEEAAQLARLAALGAPLAAKVPRGATKMTVVDYESGEPVSHDIALDPARSARDNLDRIFQHARRLRNGESTARTRLREAEEILMRLAASAERVAGAKDEDELRAAYTFPTASAARKKKLEPQALPPHRTFEPASGKVLVGRNAKRNDELTFDVAKPYHLWLHARGVPGSHVVVPLRRDQSCPADLLVDAAHLAAHFSDARGESIVEVTYVPRKYVRKPRGSAPGLVAVDREKVLTLRLEPDRLARLLAAELV